MLKNNTGAGQCSPEAIQLQQQDLVPAVEPSSQEGRCQERSSSALGREKPFGVSPCSSCSVCNPRMLWHRDTTGTAPRWLRSHGVTVTFLGAVPPAEEPRNTLTPAREGGWDCAAPGARLLPPRKGKGFRETTGKEGWGRAEIAVCSFCPLGCSSGRRDGGSKATSVWMTPQRHLGNSNKQQNF